MLKGAPMSRITTPLARKRPFSWFSKKSRHTGDRQRNINTQNRIFQLLNHRGMAEILAKRHKTPINQSIWTLKVQNNWSPCSIWRSHVLTLEPTNLIYDRSWNSYYYVQLNMYTHVLTHRNCSAYKSLLLR
jgi:hypothetical protein